MRASRRLLFFSLAPLLCLVGLVATEGDARATECHGRSLASTCVNDDTLWAHAGSARFLAIGGTEIIAPGHVGFGLVTSYLSRPIVLKIPTPGPGGSEQNVIDNQVNGTFLWALGITKRLELDAAFPVTFGQSGTGVRPITGEKINLEDTSLRDMRFGLAYAIAPRLPETDGRPARVWAMTARFEVSAPTGDRDQFAGERSAVFLPSLTADYRRGRWFAAAELGARVRPVTQLAGARVGTQVAVALGLGFDILKRELLTAVVEARALPTLVGQAQTSASENGLVSHDADKLFAPAEWTVSARTSPLLGGDLGLQLGGGGAIPITGDTPVTTPRFRFTLSIRYAPVVRDTDGDGILDADDRCPREAGPRPTGCPKPAEPPPEPTTPASPAPEPPAKAP